MFNKKKKPRRKKIIDYPTLFIFIIGILVISAIIISNLKNTVPKSGDLT